MMRCEIRTLGAALAFLLSSTLIFSCSEKQKGHGFNDLLLSVQTTTPVAQYMESNEFIEIPQSRERLETGDISTLSDEEIAKVKAALYRYYSHVELGTNRRYRVNVSSGKDIRISEEIFNIFKEDTDRMNAMLDEAEKSNAEYEVQEVTEEYLESLLY